MGRLNNRAGKSAYGQVIWGVQRVASEPPRDPGYYKSSKHKIRFSFKLPWKKVTIITTQF